MHILSTSFRYLLFTGIFFAGLKTNVFAQSVNRTIPDSLLNLLEVNQRWMGSVAALKDGQLIYEHQGMQITVTFFPETHQMELNQSGQKIMFVKEQ